MEKFKSSAEYQDQSCYSLMPFHFSRFNGGYFISNDFGEWEVLTSSQLKDLVHKRIDHTSKLYRKLKSKSFLYNGQAMLGLEILASKLKTKKEFILNFSKLHIFCMTLRCNHSCIYCQVTRKSENADKHTYDMSDEVLTKSIDVMLQCPSKAITMEFQGGESLLAIEQVKKAVQITKQKNEAIGKDITYVICTNLAHVTLETLEFFKEHNINISTSLDGPSFLHNHNRVTSGGNSYEKIKESFRLARAVLGKDCLSALMTTTKMSLEYPREIVDEYVASGLNNIFIRELNPYGFADKAASKVGYSTEEFLAFYKEVLDYIIQINLSGTFFVESFTGLILKKLLTPWAIGFVDLQSPTGTGFNVTVYNYNGNVYPSDESRMLAEMDDDTFLLGNVIKDDYQSLFFGEGMQLVASAALNESLTGCSDCAFSPFCGAEPVRRHQTQGDVIGHRPTDAYCHRNREIIKHVISLWIHSDTRVKDILMSWIRG
ncbi:His-Xaa-Ser system radical SAM maturase HxsB [Aeromonas salmonicida]|uniref:His-Xaa-Ser system radical SAM maturase HxsB n=1 Tax=Aeromonas salmonicida TaxID=645 RepID=UPI0035A6127D